MRFSELKQLENKDTGKIEIAPLLAKITAPYEVITQFYSDHGGKNEFQDQYGNIKLNEIKWKEIEVKGRELLDCNIYQNFQPYFDRVVDRVDSWKEQGWSCIDIRESVVSYWKKNKTWKTSPIFINGIFIDMNKKYHLVEGHTRVGVLCGLIKHKIIPQNGVHKIWYGDY